MQKITAGQPWALHTSNQTRLLEQHAARSSPDHNLMQRAGLASARLALALAPHARMFWIACGPGNNGGDGMEAALHLQQWGKNPVVTWVGDSAQQPVDARRSRERAIAAGVRFSTQRPDDLSAGDLCVDALLGLGCRLTLSTALSLLTASLNEAPCPVLALDLPTGLNSDSGILSAWESDADTPAWVRAHHTLSLLTLKPGQFGGTGRDACGQIWLDTLGIDTHAATACAVLPGSPASLDRSHASHKGSFGSVWVIGGARGLQGAAVLAAQSALHQGAGRVYVQLLPSGDTGYGSLPPDLMRGQPGRLPADACLVCGCGGGADIAEHLPSALLHPAPVVLDADALNALASSAALQDLLAQRGAQGLDSVLTPHPLEAARLAQITTAQVQSDRLGTAQRLAERWGCVVALKGCGTVVAAPQHVPVVNMTGNARLAIAGTGDVLAGLIGARLALGQPAFAATRDAVFLHGQMADHWPSHVPLTASRLSVAGPAAAGP